MTPPSFRLKTNGIRPQTTEQSGIGSSHGRGAARRQQAHRRVENSRRSQRKKFYNRHRQRDRHLRGGRIHLAVGKQRDGALMSGMAGVAMKLLVQRRRRGEEIQQQDKQHRQDSAGNPANRVHDVTFEPQSSGNLAELPAGANGFWFQKPDSGAALPA